MIFVVVVAVVVVAVAVVLKGVEVEWELGLMGVTYIQGEASSRQFPSLSFLFSSFSSLMCKENILRTSQGEEEC